VKQVICVDVKDLSPDTATLGKVYAVIDECRTFYTIKSDRGVETNLFKERFAPACAVAEALYIGEVSE
jgi:hypothetical protein